MPSAICKCGREINSAVSKYWHTKAHWQTLRNATQRGKNQHCLWPKIRLPNGIAKETPTPSCVQMIRNNKTPCLNSRASLSQLSRQNEIQNQKFHSWGKRSAPDIVHYRLWSARQKSV